MNIQTIIDQEAPAASRERLNQISKAFGKVPNMFKAVSQSPAALASMWGSFGALSTGTLGARLGEQIAVAVANFNHCEYCLAAHTALGKGAGVSEPELKDAQAGLSTDLRTRAALAFALTLLRNHGQVEAHEVEELTRNGFDTSQIVELISVVALNIFTNYINIALRVPVDFPAVAFRQAA
jgi:uncharacterized peroxidase-related enzyme